MKVIIAGAGPIGRRLIQRLSYRFWDIEVIDPNETVAQSLEDLPVQVHQGDAREPEMLRNAGVQGSMMFFALTGKDELNLEIARQATTYGAKRVVALCHDPAYSSRYQDEGIQVIEPAELTATVLDEMLRSPSMRGAMSLSGGVAEVVESSVLRGSPAAGQPLSRLFLPDLRVPCLVRNGKKREPDGDEILEVGDHVTLIGPTQVVHAAAHFLSGGETLFPSLYGNTILSLLSEPPSLDFSFEYALQMAELANADLTVLIAEVDPEQKPRMKDQARERARSRGVPLSILETSGDISVATPEAVQRVGASMLVLDRNEVGWLESLLGQDPLQKMISELSGMIFKVENPPTDRSFDRIGIITDGSSFSEEAAATGVELAFLMELPVEVFTVTPARDLASEEQKEQARESLEHVNEMAQLWGVPCETRILEGDPMTVIPQTFDDLTDVLAVFGVARSRSGLDEQEGLFKPRVFKKLVSDLPHSALIVK